MNNYLRQQCKLIKAMYNISYSTIAEYLNISNSSFYNWMNDAYDFGITKQYKLKEFINNIKE